MPTSLSQTDVCNLALDLLREAPLSDLTTDDTAVSRWLVRNFANSRDTVLEAHWWTFARDRSSLAADATAPEFGWSYRYALPATCLRMLPLREDGDWDGTPIPHEVESGYVLCNEAAPLKVRFIGKRDTPGTWSATFAAALAGQLAYRMAHWLTGKQSYVPIAGNYYAGQLKAAQRVDAMQGTPEHPDAAEIIEERYR